MTKKPTPKKAAKRKPPRTTAVPDRSSWPLGDEAKMLAGLLRDVGADGARAVVPGSSTDKQRKDWLERQSHFVKRVPMWMLDYAVAILEPIPIRKDRPEGRRREDATARVELLSTLMPTAVAAKFMAEIEAATSAGESRPSVDDDVDDISELAERRAQVAERAEKLARRVYRQRKSGVPKPQ